VKHPKLLSIAAATVVVGSSAFVASGTASAADLPGAFSSEYVNTTAQLTPNPDVLPTGSGWNVYTGIGIAAPAFGIDGVSTPAPTTESPFSVFALTHATTAPIGSLADIVTQGSIVSSGLVLPIFVVSDGTQSEIVTPELGSSSDPDATAQSFFAADAQWSVAPYEQTTPTSVQTTGTISEVQAALQASSATWSITGYGIEGIDVSTFPSAQVRSLAQSDSALAPLADVAPNAAAASDTAATVATLSVDNATTHFTPTPTLTLGATSTTVSAFSTTGVTVTATGFLPGETVSSAYATDASGDTLPATFVADAGGNVSGTVVGPAGIAAGNYSIVLVGETSAVSVSTPLAVTADPAVAIPTAQVPVAVRAAATFAG
jgi:hypothetical protein